MGRPPVKSSKAVAAAQTKGRLEAETKFWDKQPLLKKLKRLMWRKLEQLDPIKMVALGTTTYLIHGVIITSEQLMQTVSNYFTKTTQGKYTWFGEVFAGMFGAVGVAAQYVSTATGFLGYASSLEAEKQLKSLSSQQDLMVWIISFSIAYLMVEHGGEITGMLLDGGKGVGTLVTSLLA